MNALSSAVATRPRHVVNVEVDDRTVLFPNGNFLTHIAVSSATDQGATGRGATGRGADGLAVRLDAVFMFNEQRSEPQIAVLELDDARDFARACLEAVFQGRTQHVLSDAAKVAVIFNPNGFVVKFGEERALRELFIASPAIIRLAQGVMRIVDNLDAPAPH